MLVVPSWLFGRPKRVLGDPNTAAKLLKQAEQQEVILKQMLAEHTEANQLERRRLQLLRKQLHGISSSSAADD